MGRPKGSGNKPDKRVLADYMAKKFGATWNPVVEMASGCIKLQEIAEKSGEASDYKASVEALEKVSRFLIPTLRAVEVSNPDGGLTVKIQRKNYSGQDNKETPPSEGE
tara:strand:+ start:480 stop:803 length:324 start_codon:yes stop_codon:yes gene_type:complete